MARKKKIIKIIPNRQLLKDCLYCAAMERNHCVCTDENRALDKDDLNKRLLARRLTAEGNLLVNSHMFAYERKTLKLIDKYL